jgi:hypothetical protein
MNEALPRQTYRTESDGENEERIAELFAQWARAKQLKIGKDDPDKQKPRIDRLLYRQHVVAFFEIKTCSYAWGYWSRGWCTGRAKVELLRQLASIVRVPVLLVVEFDYGTLGYVDVNTEYAEIADFGRDDRADRADREPGALFNWGKLNRCNQPRSRSNE